MRGGVNLGDAVRRLNVWFWVVGVVYVSVRCEVDNRQELGHWQGDLIIGKKNQTVMVTLVKRFSRHTLLAVLPDTVMMLLTLLKPSPKH